MEIYRSWRPSAGHGVDIAFRPTAESAPRRKFPDVTHHAHRIAHVLRGQGKDCRFRRTAEGQAGERVSPGTRADPETSAKRLSVGIAMSVVCGDISLIDGLGAALYARFQGSA